MTKITPPSRDLPADAPSSMADDNLYAHDFVAWLDRQAALLRDGRLDRLDLANLAEELEDMSKRQRQELRNRLEVLLTHLLKYEFQPTARTGSWLGTILEQRHRIADAIEESPSLRPYLDGLHDDRRLYRRALTMAAAETGLPAARLPADNPYGARALDETFWPGAGPHPEL